MVVAANQSAARGSASLNRVGEECAGVVKTATFDADQLIVKSAVGSVFASHQDPRSRRALSVIVRKNVKDSNEELRRMATAKGSIQPILLLYGRFLGETNFTSRRLNGVSERTILCGEVAA